MSSRAPYDVIDIHWPSGDERSAAMFDVHPDVLSAQTGLIFDAGCDDLDYYREVGLRLPSGRPVSLLWYERAPVLGLTLQIDAQDDATAARIEAMTALGLTEQQLMWTPETGEDSA